MARVGFIGAGQMGMPMIERLLTAGHSVRAHARRVEVHDAIEAAGGLTVPTARAAAETSDVVIACLFSDEQLLDACSGPEGVLAGLGAGSVLTSHVTGTRATLFQLAAAVEERGASLVDAPVSGTADDIRAGQLTVLLGGDRSDVLRCSAVMAAYASRLLPVGGLGAGLAVKLVNNLLFAAHSQLAVAAVELGAAFGVSSDTLLSALGSCSGASYAVATLSTLPDVDTYARLAGPFLQKDVAACRAELAAGGGGASLLLDVVDRGRLALSIPT